MYVGVFKGKDKYTVGIIFLFGTLAGFYLNMRKLAVNDIQSSLMLFALALCARLVV
jgi:hypothetical protein